MNVLLIYPKFPDTFWSFKHALKFIHKKASSPPLGLLTIASMLPSDWHLKLVDMNVTPLKKKDLGWADYAFISAMTVQRESVLEVINLCNEAGVKTVCGGPLFSTEPQAFSGIDHLVLNEAEITLPMFLEDFVKNQLKPLYTTEKFADMKKTPPPMWDLVNFKDYASVSIQYTRGCPFNCEFCNITSMLGHKMRLKTASQILVELDGLYQRGWHGGIFFVDDNLIGNKKALREELLPALVDWRKGKSGIAFNTEVSINLADDNELMSLMVKAGFNMVFIGIETPDDDNLAECSKFQNRNRDLAADVRRIQSAGMQVQGGFIVGFDNDSPSTFQRLVDFIQNTGIVTAMVGILQAPVGTRLYERMQKAGRIIADFTGDNVAGSTNIIPKMNVNLLTNRYKELIRHIYSPEVYYQRVKTFLTDYRLPKIKPDISFSKIWQDLGAFVQSIFKLGIFGKERKQYWGLIFWTLFKKPKLFPLAITFSIYGYHYRKVSETHI
ncbi:MAG: B12-binding domain-containing radical SAM protein [Pelolinea sp.]|nr:B12-binding domain-containing radical SAM protein [Pelolinea sp.]